MFSKSVQQFGHGYLNPFFTLIRSVRFRPVGLRYTDAADQKSPPGFFASGRGGGGANLLEPEPITSKVGIVVSWKKEQVDTVRLAKLRWVDKWSYEQIAAEFGIGRTKVIVELRRAKSAAQSRKAK